MVRKFTAALLCLVLQSALAQTAGQNAQNPGSAPQPQSPSGSPQTAPSQTSATEQNPSSSQNPPAIPQLVGFGLEDGTPVKLRLTRNLSSESDKKGDTVDFEAIEDVSAGGVIVIPKGSTAWATVTEAQPKRRMGRGGKLNVNIDSVRLKDGEKVPLRAVKENRGGGHVGAMTGAMVATGIVFFPAAPLFLFMHGKEINVPKGTEITAYIAGNTPLDKSKFDGSAPAAANPATTASSVASISLTSTPSGAEIEVDGKFMGNTPSTLTVTAGDHVVKVTKKGYKVWQRTLATSSGNVNLTAELEEDK